MLLILIFLFQYDEEFLNRQEAQSQVAKCEDRIVELQEELQAFKSQVQAQREGRHIRLLNYYKSAIKIFTVLFLFPIKICSFNFVAFGLDLLLTGAYTFGLTYCTEDAAPLAS